MITWTTTHQIIIKSTSMIIIIVIFHYLSKVVFNIVMLLITDSTIDINWIIQLLRLIFLMVICIMWILCNMLDLPFCKMILCIEKVLKTMWMLRKLWKMLSLTTFCAIMVEINNGGCLGRISNMHKIQQLFWNQV